MYPYHILLIEDSVGLAAVISKVLQNSGYEVTWYQAIPPITDELIAPPSQLLVLDTALLIPQSAPVLADFITKNGCLVLALVAHIQDLSLATNLGVPADEYLTKPFGASDLLHRVRMLLRRASVSLTRLPQSQMAYSGLTLDTEVHTLTVNGEEVGLTAIEYKVLHLFLSQPRRVFTREELVKMAWGVEYIGEDRVVDHLLSRLRKKMGAQGEKIETIRGVGYRLK
jgi:DNA-binding response OmpR family regulator